MLDFSALSFTCIRLISTCSLLLGSCLAFALPARFFWGGHFSGPNLEGRLLNAGPVRTYQPGSDQSDWFKLEHRLTPYNFRSNPIVDASTADLAAQHWNHFASDYSLLPELGLNTASISLSWEKINPAPGIINLSALAHYQERLKVLRGHGIKVIVALSERTHPQWFFEQGGWNSPMAPAHYFEYARAVINELNRAGTAPLAWVTFVDPIQDALQGYLYASTPPFLNSTEGTFEALFQMGRAHRMIASYIHEVQGYSPVARDALGFIQGVGIIQSVRGYFSSTSGPIHPSRLENIRSDLNWSFAQSLLSRTLSWGSYKRTYPLLDLPPENPSAPTLDWIGLKPAQIFEVDQQGVFKPWPIQTPLLGWRLFSSPAHPGHVLSPGFVKHVIQDHIQRLGLPLVLYGGDAPDPSEEYRAPYLSQFLEILTTGFIQTTKVDLRGMVLGTVIDGFDGLDGYTLKRGLVEINRSFKSGAKILRDKIQSTACTFGRKNRP